jgi:methyltransferase (TIGR00027 family)
VSDGTIQNISDTALWVAMYRAYESERRDAVFHDPYARRLAGERGEQIVRSMPNGQAMAWPMVARTFAFDDIVLRLTKDGGVDTVVNLAAGLDARPWRLDLPPSLRWIDVDLPHMLEHKWRVMAGETAHCRYQPRPMDLREPGPRRELFAEIGSSSRSVMVMSEGLLIYLERESVVGLAQDLASVPSFRWWALDMVAPMLLARLKRQWGQNLEVARAPLVFAPAEGTAFFLPYGWKEREFHSTMEDAIRLKRLPAYIKIWQVLNWLVPRAQRELWRRMSGNVVLERVDPIGS